MHLIVDGYGGDPSRMKDTELIYRLLDRYPSQIGMKKIAPPQVFEYVGEKPWDWGVSGFVLIAESHISIHTFPERAYVNIDIFSCKDFDADEAIRDLQDQFGLTRLETQVLPRGLEYPPHVEAAAQIVGEERRQLLDSTTARHQ